MKKNDYLMPAKNKLSIFKKIRKSLKNIFFTINIIVIILMFLSYLAWSVKPSTTTFFSYIGLGFVFVLTLNIFFLLFWVAFRKWKFVIIQLVFILICWKPISTYFPIHFKTKNVPNDCIKLLTYNVKGFDWKTGKKATDNPIIEYIVNSGADIVCLQEFAVSNEKNNNSLITKDKLNKILKDYPYHSIERLGNSSKQYDYGIACYSKYPIIKSSLLPISSSFNGSVMYQLKVKGKTVTLINNHLESNRVTSDDIRIYRQFFKTQNNLDEVTKTIKKKMGIAFNVRESQTNIIRKYIDADQSDALIVCGDFNDTPISYTYNSVKGDLVDSYASSGLGQGITYHENKFFFRIDYIMHSRNMESFNCTVDQSIKTSDHYPVYTYLRFK